MTEVSRIKLDGQDLEAVEFDDETKLWKFYKNSKSTLDLMTKLPKVCSADNSSRKSERSYVCILRRSG